MAGNVRVDGGFLIALLSRRDRHHSWAALTGLLRRGAVLPAFDLADELDRALDLLRKYANVPMSLADACLVRMSETLSDPLILTTDANFRIYRRHGRQVIPCMTP